MYEQEASGLINSNNESVLTGVTQSEVNMTGDDETTRSMHQMVKMHGALVKQRTQKVNYSQKFKINSSLSQNSCSTLGFEFIPTSLIECVMPDKFQALLDMDGISNDDLITSLR